MRLIDVRKPEDFEAYYSENNLRTEAERARSLSEGMMIRAIRGNESESEAEKLAGLEELVLQGFWRASAR